MLLHLRHETLYHYTPAVENAQHTVHLRPNTGVSQTVLQHALYISPQPVQQREGLDVYGNSKLFFSLQTPHDELKVIADSVVQSHARPANSSKARLSILAVNGRCSTGSQSPWVSSRLR